MLLFMLLPRLIVLECGDAQEPRSMWRIMVPERHNEGRDFTQEEHKAWEDAVLAVSGGWTTHATARGAWTVPEDSSVQVENMRPVDILCTKPQIDTVAAMTVRHYEQKEVLVWKVADERDVMLYHPEAQH
jgi:hypothetical protein